MEDMFSNEVWKPVSIAPFVYLSNLGRCKKGDKILKKSQSRYRIFNKEGSVNIHINTWMKELFPNDVYNEVSPTVFTDLFGEVWKNVLGWEGLYQVSNMNRARRLDSYRDFKNTKMFIKGGLCSLSINKKGYYVFGININKKPRTLLLHRMVALSFIPNPDNLPEVNHENGNKLDCTPKNLKWCTSAYNMQHAWDTGLRKKQ